MYGYIYKTTDLTTGKIYIGQHKGAFDPTYLGSGKLITQAIRENGVGSFLVMLLCEAFTREDLNMKERHYIKILKARDKLIGYNLAYGGEGAFGFNWSDDDKVRIGNISRGKIMVSKDGVIKRISKEEMQTYLDNGFVLGRTSEVNKRISDKLVGRTINDSTKLILKASILGRHMVNNGVEVRQVGGSELDRLLKLGWVSGMLPMSDHQKDNIRKSLIGKRASDETRRKHSNSLCLKWEDGSYTGNRGLVFVNNGVVNKQVPKGTILEDGWSYGMKPKKEYAKYKRTAPAWNKGVCMKTGQAK